MNNDEAPKVRSGHEVLESIERILVDAQPMLRNLQAAQPRKIESDSCIELYKALAAAQKAFSDVEKSGMIGGRNIPYAKIDDLTNASRAVLRAQHLVSNTFTIMEQGIEMLITRLVHY